MQERAGQAFQDRYAGLWAVRRADLEEQGAVEAVLLGKRRHLHADDLPTLDAALLVERRWMIA